MPFESRVEIERAAKMLPTGGRLRVGWQDLRCILEKPGVNTLLFDDPRLKNLFIFNLVDSTLGEEGLVVYIDIDASFTLHLEEWGWGLHRPVNLRISRPRAEDIDGVVAQACSIKVKALDLLVFDSTTTFYHIFGERVNYGSLNRKLGVYLHLFRGLAVRTGAQILVTSLARAKRSTGRETSVWIRRPSGGRILRAMSDVVAEVGREEGVRLKLLKHPSKDLKGRLLLLPLEPLDAHQKHPDEEGHKYGHQT